MKPRINCGLLGAENQKKKQEKREGRKITEMKKIKVFFSLLLTLAFALSFTACAGDLSGFKLGAFVLSDESDRFDSKYFYRNDLNVFGGDADVIWVPDERDSEYGGWFYMYMSGNDGVPVQLEPDGSRSAVTVLRSRDLNDWELCGAVSDGFGVRIESDEWIIQHVWAPEVVYNEKDGKYYMYFNAFAPFKSDEEPWFNVQSDNMYDRFYGAVLMADDPVGPFRLATSERYYGDATKANLNGQVITGRTPQINVTAQFGLDYVFSVIDFSPFFDENGDFYLYFVRHMSTGHDHNCMWGVKMKDMITPDYDTLTMLAACNYESVEYVGGAARYDEDAYVKTGYFGTDSGTERDETKDAGLWGDEGAINEGPHMYYADGRYYLIYSPQGFASPTYDTKQAIGDSPLGPFKKLPWYPSVIMGKNDTNDYMTGTGHCAFVEMGGELFCIYWVHADPFSGETSASDGRIYGFDRVYLVEDAVYGKLLYGNGPTKSVQPKPYGVTGRKNVAPEATVSATNAYNDTLHYLNDGLFVTHQYYSEREFTSKGKTTITFKFDVPKKINAVLVYNSFDYDYAFSGLEGISFKLSEKPSWYNLSEYVDECFIENIPFIKDYYDAENKFMRQGGASVVSFDDITVSEVKIVVSSKISDANKEIKISDVVILGE